MKNILAMLDALDDEDQADDVIFSVFLEAGEWVAVISSASSGNPLFDPCGEGKALRAVGEEVEVAVAALDALCVLP